MSLEDSRRKLDDIDARLVKLVAERQQTVRDIVAAKRSSGQAVRDYNREREVLRLGRENAERAGVSPEVAEELLRLLIRYSLTTQEQARVVAHRAGTGRRALLIGGAGKMGAWFATFLDSQGFSVEVADPAAAAGNGALADWEQSDLQHDLIVVATPLGKTNGVLLKLAERRPPGVIFDLASLKSPLRTGLHALKAAGLRVTSLHPMFGPDTELLTGRHVIFVDLQSGNALEEARRLFAPTMAEQVVMSLDEHDRLIAYVLGMSHALNIAFVNALSGSGEAAPRLVNLSSTTFDAQFDIARRVTEENAELYYEIQHLNDYGRASLDALVQAVEAVRSAALDDDQSRFVSMMLAGRDYAGGRQLPD